MHISNQLFVESSGNHAPLEKSKIAGGYVEEGNPKDLGASKGRLRHMDLCSLGKWQLRVKVFNI